MRASQLGTYFEPIFFSLIFAQKLYIYGRRDSHHTKSIKQVSPFVKGLGNNLPVAVCQAQN
ncbi:hypothetical protein B5D77_10385 [Microcystis sp. MC19]|nr:hypothetical protein B5D77_10385 [Microcystis sp. MC19]